MNITFLIILGLVFICFIVPAVRYAITARKGNFNRGDKLADSAFLPIFAILLPATLVGLFLFYTPDDFIGSFNVWQLLVPFTGALLISLPSLRHKLSLILPVAAILSVAVMPADSINIIPEFPPLVNRLILAVVWSAFAFIYRYANSGDGVLAVQSITISVGIGILAALNAVPLLLGAFGWMFAASFAALMAFSWYPSRIKISAENAIAFGFLLFSLIAPAAGEGVASCCIIFSLFVLIDFCWALMLRLTFIPRYADISANSAFQQAVDEGMDPAQAAAFTVKIQLLVLFFGCFQIYSPTPWSLLMISAMIIIWLIYRFRNLPPPTQSVKNINAQVLEELQERVNEFKNYVKKDNDF